MNLIDLLDDNAESDRAYHREYARVQLSGPCEDSHEVTCPLIGMMPDESNTEEGSPLNFGMATIREMDRQYNAALVLGTCRVPNPGFF